MVHHRWKHRCTFSKKEFKMKQFQVNWQVQGEQLDRKLVQSVQESVPYGENVGVLFQKRNIVFIYIFGVYLSSQKRFTIISFLKRPVCEKMNVDKKLHLCLDVGYCILSTVSSLTFQVQIRSLAVHPQLAIVRWHVWVSSGNSFKFIGQASVRDTQWINIGL